MDDSPSSEKVVLARFSKMSFYGSVFNLALFSLACLLISAALIVDGIRRHEWSWTFVFLSILFWTYPIGRMFLNVRTYLTWQRKTGLIAVYVEGDELRDIFSAEGRTRFSEIRSVEFVFSNYDPARFLYQDYVEVHRKSGSSFRIQGKLLEPDGGEIKRLIIEYATQAQPGVRFR